MTAGRHRVMRWILVVVCTCGLLWGGSVSLPAQQPATSPSPAVSPAVPHGPLPVITSIHRSTFFLGQQPYYRFRVQVTNTNSTPTDATNLTLRLVPANKKSTAAYQETLVVAALNPQQSCQMQTGRVTLGGHGRYIVHCTIGETTVDRTFTF